MIVTTVESGPGVLHRLTPTQARILRSSGLVAVGPVDDGTWVVSGAGKVGVARVGDMTVRIEPKLPIGRILFLLGYAKKFMWADETVSYGTTEDLVSVLASAFARQAERALVRGVIQGYVEVEDELAVVRGRLRAREQLTRRFGQVTPLMVRYDDFTIDIAENRLIKAAASLLRTVPELPAPTARRLRSLVLQLDTVANVNPGEPIPTWSRTRRNAHYESVLGFATTILRHRSIDLVGGDVEVNGFVVNMATVFEDFLETALGDALERIDGRVRPQDASWLDTDLTVEMKPDLVWHRGGRVAAVIDAKYKAEKPAGYPNADRYQMLAYCTALGLSTGHLVYAKGNEPESNIEVVNAGTRIVTHALDLEAMPKALLAQVDDIARTIAAHATDSADEDEQLLEVLRSVTPAQWDELRALFVRLAAEDNRPGEWAGGGHTPEGTIQLGYFAYSETTNRLTQLLYEAGFISNVFDWPQWWARCRFQNGTNVGVASPPDLVRILTSVVRGDRFSEGALATYVVNGTIPTAINRLCEWQSKKIGTR